MYILDNTARRAYTTLLALEERFNCNGSPINQKMTSDPIIAVAGITMDHTGELRTFVIGKPGQLLILNSNNTFVECVEPEFNALVESAKEKGVKFSRMTAIEAMTVVNLIENYNKIAKEKVISLRVFPSNGSVIIMI